MVYQDINTKQYWWENTPLLYFIEHGNGVWFYGIPLGICYLACIRINYYYYCYYYHFSSLLLTLFLLSLLISWCAVLINTPGLCDLVVMRVLSDFYWTSATGAGLFTSHSAQRHVDHCVQAARALCWERVSLTWIPLGTECWLLINQIRESGKNESTFCAANLQVVTQGCHAVAFLAET